MTIVQEIHIGAGLDEQPDFMRNVSCFLVCYGPLACAILQVDHTQHAACVAQQD